MSSQPRTLTDAELDAVLARLPELDALTRAATNGPVCVGHVDETLDPGEWFKEHLKFGNGPIWVAWLPDHPASQVDDNDKPTHAVLLAITGNGPDSLANVEWLVSARRDIPDLLAAVETLREQRDALARNMKTLEDAYYQQVRELAELRAKQEPSDA